MKEREAFGGGLMPAAIEGAEGGDAACRPESVRSLRDVEARAGLSVDDREAIAYFTYADYSNGTITHEKSAVMAERLVQVALQHERALILLNECADEIEATVEAQYALSHQYPSEERRYNRDMELVRLTRAFLTSATPTTTPPDSTPVTTAQSPADAGRMSDPNT